MKITIHAEFDLDDRFGPHSDPWADIHDVFAWLIGHPGNEAGRRGLHATDEFERERYENRAEFADLFFFKASLAIDGELVKPSLEFQEEG